MYLQEALKETGWATKKSDPCKGRRYRASHRDIVDQNNRVAHFNPVEIAIHDDWEPYKEPCSHEPRHWRIKENPFWVYEFVCFDCGVKIEPTGWREINSGNADNKTK